MNTKEPAKIVTILVLTLMLTACAGQSSQPTPLTRDNLMYARQPQVQFLSSHATSPVVVRCGARQAIAVGDAVTVDDRGQARMRFSDFLVIDVYPNTELRNIDLIPSIDPTAPPAFRMRLEGGSIFGNLDAQHIANQRVRPEFRLDTEWAVVKALGTLLWVYYDRGTQVTWVVVKESEVSVTAAGKEVIVHAGQQAWVEPGKPPIDPIPACRNLIGDRFPLIDELTNGDRSDLDLLCQETTPLPLAQATRTVITVTPTPRPASTPAVRPGRPPSPTFTPSRGPTMTFTPTPTPTRTPSLTPIPSPTPFVAFSVSPDTVPVCSICTVAWNTGNVREVYYQGSVATGSEARQEFIQALGENTFNLDVLYPNGQQQRFAATVVGEVAPLGSSLRDSVDGELWAAQEVALAYFGQDPYRCVGSTGIPAIVQADLPGAQVVRQQIDDLAAVLSVWLVAGDVPAYLVLAYPPDIIASLDPVIDEWPYGVRLYAWDQSSNSLRLLQYRTGPPPAPDLVVTSFKTMGSAQYTDNGYELPVRLTVANQGNADADVFKVSVDYTTDQGSFVVPFTVSSPDHYYAWYPYTSGPLAPGASVLFDGVVTFAHLSSLNCRTLSLSALADSCSGDEFMPPACRVAESDEGNNQSAPLIVPPLFCLE